MLTDLKCKYGFFSQVITEFYLRYEGDPFHSSACMKTFLRGKLGGRHWELPLGLDFYLSVYLQPRSVHVSQDFVAPSVGHLEHLIWKYL